MQNNILTIELLNRILGNLGIIPDSFGSLGITEPNFVLKEKLVIEEENKKINKYNIYSAENIIDNNKIKVLFSNLSQTDIDLILIINIDDLFISIRKTNDFALFLKLYNNNWVEIDMVHKLNITAAFELIVQNGYSWTPCVDYKNVYDVLISFLKSEEEF